MILLTKAIIGIWLITGIIGLVWGTKALYRLSERHELKKYLKGLADEVQITEEDFFCVLHVAFFIAGIAGVFLAFYRKIRKFIKERFHV